MEFSTNSMSDNSFDKDNPLKQVLQLCSTLAGKGCEFSISVRIKDSFSFSLKSGKPQDKKGKKRSPSFYRRQERRKLLKKKNKDCSLEQPLETPESKQKDTCSLDLNPHPDSDLFGLRENSEEESDEESDSGSETSRNASRGDQEAVSEDQEDMDTDGHWKVVSRGRRRSDRSLSPVYQIGAAGLAERHNRLTLQRLTWQAQFTSATPANSSHKIAYRRSLTLVFGTQPPESPKESSNTSTNYKNTNSAAQISSNIESQTNVMFFID